MVILIASTGFAELRESRSDRSASAENQADLTLSFTAIGYLGELSYHNTTAKDLSLIQGIYLAAAWGEEHLLEAEFDSLEISFRYPWTLNQQDITLAYANYSIPNLKLRAGGHFLGGDDEATSDGRALFAGTRYYVPYNLEGYYVQYSWDIGLEGCVSSYPHYTNGLSVCQLTLSHGFNLCHGDGWYCRNEAKAYWIHTGE
ncbi:MAG: hypothetical protein WCL44_15555, partial [bacterium]